MSQQNLEKFGAYQKAMELFDLVVNDMTALSKEPLCWRLNTQQIGSADSIAANIEEGYGRISQAEYKRFLDIARASARETRGRYSRMKYWLTADTITHRQKLLDEIIGILTKTIGTLQTSMNSARGSYFGVSEGSDEGRGMSLFPYTRPSTLDPRHPTLDTRHNTPIRQ